MMMDEQIGTQFGNYSKPYASFSGKPTSFYKNDKEIFVSISDFSVVSFEFEKTFLNQIALKMHEKRINCIRAKDNILITGSKDFTVKLWDKSTGKPIHTFTKPGSQFNCLDLSQHILCAAHSSKLVFWDLRKMKQRSQFNDSFNGQITSLQFDPLNPTCFMGCSVDGMINKFDLRQPNEEEAFVWGTRVMECPSKLQSIKDITLVQTTNHSLLLLEQQAVKKKINVNDFDEPKHILSSNLIPNGNTFDIQYFRWNLQKQLVEKFINDSNVGYIPNVYDSEIFTPINNDKIFYSTEKGDVYIEKVMISLSQCKTKSNNTQKNVSQNQIQKWEKIEEEKPVNDTGFILDKPMSFKSKIKKFKPF